MAHHVQTGNEDAPCAGAELTLNSSLVAAATPRLPVPVWPTAEPLTTMSLRYTPGLARPGTTSSRETRAALPGAICTAGPENWIQDGGTARPGPRLSRSTRMLTASACVPVLTTSSGSAYLSPRCAMLSRRTGLTCTPTPTLASDVCGKPASVTRATGTASGTASNRHRCISTPPVLHLFHIITGQTGRVNHSVPDRLKTLQNVDQAGLHNVRRKCPRRATRGSRRTPWQSFSGGHCDDSVRIPDWAAPVARVGTAPAVSRPSLVGNAAAFLGAPRPSEA